MESSTRTRDTAWAMSEENVEIVRRHIAVRANSLPSGRSSSRRLKRTNLRRTASRRQVPRVVVSNTAHLRGREEIRVSARSTFVFAVENGRIARVRMYQEREEPLEAAGLRE